MNKKQWNLLGIGLIILSMFRFVSTGFAEFRLPFSHTIRESVAMSVASHISIILLFLGILFLICSILEKK